MKSTLMILGVLTLSFLGCGKENPASNETSKSASPQDRWPEEGSFSYQFNENGCNTGKKEFEKKWEYCIALTDIEFNSGCARGFRKATYKRECGDDFEERNFGSYMITGYDSRLRKNCRTAENSGFAKKVEYCSFLQDEIKHEGCFWDFRKKDFLEAECQGDFSSEPRVVDPAPNPNPSPNPKPDPNPIPQPGLPPVVQELEAAGIKVIVIPPSTPEFPGEKPFREKLKLFWVELESAKEELLQRKSQIQELNISSYTIYSSSNRNLVLDVGFQGNEIREYFQYFDRKLRLENSFGFTLDMGIEIYGHEQNKFQRMKEVLQFFESKSVDLKKIRGVVRSIEFKSFSTYFASNRSLMLDEDSYQKAFGEYFLKLQPMSKFLASMDSTKVKLELDFDLEKDFAKVKTLFPILEKETNALRELISLNKLQTISIKSYSDEAKYYANLKNLWIPMESPGVDLFSAYLKFVRFLFTSEDKLGIKVESLIDDNKNFILAADRFSAVSSEIEKKKSKIRRIVLSFKSEFSFGTLYIGYEGTLADLKKIISQIQ
jgi:hypothetical protein